MKTGIIAVFLFFLICPGLCLAKGEIQDGLYELYLRPSVLTSLARYDMNEDGFIWDFQDNGEFKVRGRYQGGLLSGPEVGYFATGELKYKRMYQQGRLHGISREYYKNGQVSCESVYLNGEPHGLARYFDENGRLRKIVVYSKGRMVKIRNLSLPEEPVQ